MSTQEQDLQNIDWEREKDLHWALANLDSSLPKYYEVIVWLIDKGAKCYLEDLLGDSDYNESGLKRYI